VGTYSAWESTATLRLLGVVRRREERGGGILCRHAHSLLLLSLLLISSSVFVFSDVPTSVVGRVCGRRPLPAEVGLSDMTRVRYHQSTGVMDSGRTSSRASHITGVGFVQP